MSDSPSSRLSPFTGHLKAGRFGQPEGDPGISISERTGLTIVQVDGRAEQRAELSKIIATGLHIAPPDEANTVIRETGLSAIWTGPARWLFVSDTDRQPDTYNLLSDLLNDKSAAVTDLSHARGVLNITGPNVREVLTKGCGLDLHPSVFKVEACAQTSISHTGVLLDCRDVNNFDLYISRSYAAFFAEWLINAGREYGVEVTAAPK